jgi:hypothetical protein
MKSKRYRKSLLIFILAEREGLFALRAHPSGRRRQGLRRSTRPDSRVSTWRYAPRPYGGALRALSPLRCPRGQLIQTDENLPNVWRRGRDCSSLRSSSSASLRTVAAALQRPKSPSAILSNPLFHISGSNPRFVAATTERSRPTRIERPMAEREGFEPSKGF